ncbi:cytochrome c3 family protein, partial [bacterium]|nr:cytochrome c3 family protein [bacterium]
MPNEEQKKKGTFSKLRLPISKKYIYPASRVRMLVLGVLGCVIAAGYFGVDSFFLDNSFISNGPLSSSHANLEKNCAACHEPFSAVQSDNCSTCHETSTVEAAFYSFSGHYGTASKDEISASLAQKEVPCFACHAEHQGRSASILTAPDSKCVGCHDYGSFNDRHPEFEFLRTKKPDNANLIFTHINHVMGYIGGSDAEKTCSTCHTLQADGKHFDAINFENHCSDCHLSQEGDNDARVAQTLMLGSNAANFVGRYCYVGSGAGGFDAV